MSLLAITGLTKRFTGTLALDHVDFDVRKGEVHAGSHAGRGLDIAVSDEQRVVLDFHVGE